MPEQSMTNVETAAHLRRYVTKVHGVWSWPTDGCGYDQHVQFVAHRNRHWHGGTIEAMQQFILEYAESLEHEEA